MSEKIKQSEKSEETVSENQVNESTSQNSSQKESGKNNIVTIILAIVVIVGALFMFGGKEKLMLAVNKSKVEQKLRESLSENDIKFQNVSCSMFISKCEIQKVSFDSEGEEVSFNSIDIKGIDQLLVTMANPDSAKNKNFSVQVDIKDARVDGKRFFEAALENPKTKESVKNLKTFMSKKDIDRLRNESVINLYLKQDFYDITKNSFKSRPSITFDMTHFIAVGASVESEVKVPLKEYFKNFSNEKSLLEYATKTFVHSATIKVKNHDMTLQKIVYGVYKQDAQRKMGRIAELNQKVAGVKDSRVLDFDTFIKGFAKNLIESKQTKPLEQFMSIDKKSLEQFAAGKLDTLVLEGVFNKKVFNEDPSVAELQVALMSVGPEAMLAGLDISLRAE